MYFGRDRKRPAQGSATGTLDSTRLEAETLTEDFAACGFATVPSLQLLSEAVAIAFAHDRSLFECLYAAFAQASANWITADERLADALAARFPVKRLGAF
jgi:predicted nucleic acid-binding protein